MTFTHIWTLVCVWTVASGVKLLYPKLGGSETLTCECKACQIVYWYRFDPGDGTFTFLLSYSIVGKAEPGEGFSISKFSCSAQEQSKVIFSLRILDLQESDAGHYSCVFHNMDRDPAMYFIRPGVPAPTLKPVTASPSKPRHQRPKPCTCGVRQPEGCESKVLWPLSGALLVLVVALISMLYYFSRLPKKCRHQFVKQKHMT